MTDNTRIREIESYLHDYCGWVDYCYHTGRSSLKIAEIDEWIDVVQRSILLDSKLDLLHLVIDKAQEDFDKALDEQRKLEDQFGIWGGWRRVVDDT